MRPWSPPGADSLLAWSAEAKTLFQLNRGDSVTGGNYRAYELVGVMGRRLFRALGKENMAQAKAIEAVLDSLGLDADVAIDPTLPAFVLLMVRNPYQPSANAVGFVYWFRQDDLRMQGVVFRGGMDPRIRVWWTGRNREPYEWGIVDRMRGSGDLGLILLRLDPGGSYWTIGQYAGRGQDLGGSGEADWVDANEDGQPELLTWMRASPDSMFEECGGCPKLITERLFVEHDSGFELHDSRLLPSPYSTFVLFIRLLRDKNRAAASRLLVHPEKLDEAIKLGWAGSKGKGAWKLEYTEDHPWPRWLAMRFQGNPSRPIYIVHFTMKDARWIIESWTPVRQASATTPPRGARNK